MWTPALPLEEWQKAHATFDDSDRERGQWKYAAAIPNQWNMTYGQIHFWAKLTAFRHLGVFPEQAPLWEWMLKRMPRGHPPLRVLNLFGYTGIASLLMAKAGAMVTHVDASKQVVAWAADNQRLSGLEQSPIRWIVDDAFKFVQRELRRGVRYDGILLDPPKFGRGPKGEVWKLEESLPLLLRSCRDILSANPRFIVTTVYAIRASSLSLTQLLTDIMQTHHGAITGGELVTAEKRAGRYLSHALFTRWEGRLHG